jgi:hypothetical protein
MRSFFLFFVALMAMALVCSAADKAYQAGKLVDVDSQLYSKLVGDTTVIRHQNDLSVRVGDVIYIGECHEKRHWSSCRPGNWIVGDPIEVWIEKDSMYLRKPNGGDVRTKIVKRVRVR